MAETGLAAPGEDWVKLEAFVKALVLIEIQPYEDWHMAQSPYFTFTPIYATLREKNLPGEHWARYYYWFQSSPPPLTLPPFIFFQD